MSNLTHFGKSHIYDSDTFIINGRMSPFIKGSYLPVIFIYIPNYSLSTIRDVDHWVHAEAHDDKFGSSKKVSGYIIVIYSDIVLYICSIIL